MTRLTKEQFIERALSIHGSKYAYDKVNYLNRATKVTITCKIHGDFEQTPSNHFAGKGCKRCTGGHNRHSLELFLEKARAVHKDVYDYSKVIYKGNKVKVTIGCKEHGYFEQSPHHHLSGHGCLKCSGTATLSKDEFVFKARLKHGDKYDYSKSEYKSSSTKLTITCKNHGDFRQSPDNHYVAGCPKCSVYGFDSNKPGNLYILYDGDITKVGITNRNVSSRVKSLNATAKSLFYVYKSAKFKSGKQAKNVESILLDYLKLNFSQISRKFAGSTECFFNVDRDELSRMFDKLVEEHNGTSNRPE